MPILQPLVFTNVPAVFGGNMIVCVGSERGGLCARICRPPQVNAAVYAVTRNFRSIVSKVALVPAEEF